MLHTTRVGQGPLPMVFVHGLFGQGKNFGAIARGLNQRATSLLVDAPNHGLSPWTTTFDYGLFAEMLAETITTHCGDQPVVLAGHSMGAKIAMRLALDMPQMVDRLIVMDMAPARSGSIEEFAQIIRALQGLDLRAIDTRAQADQRLAGQIDNPAIRAFLLQSLQRGDDGWRWLMNLDLLGHSLDALADWPPTRTGSWPRPVLWLVGEHSPLRPARQEARMHSFFPDTELVTISSAGHWIHADQPIQVISAIKAFC